MAINYDHKPGIHSKEGPRAALPILFEDSIPTSLLDVGCGIGTWVKSALDLGVGTIIGLDGVQIPKAKLLFPAALFQQVDLTTEWDLDRKFDVALCLEVAEHLDSTCAPSLIKALSKHTDVVIFSAACPGQHGQHHVNCQWPAYWQALFNENGMQCDDTIRWKIWDDRRIEPWYRQNIFIARRCNPSKSTERRIKSVIHPDMSALVQPSVPPASFEDHVKQIENGRMSLSWYLKVLPRALRIKIKSRLKLYTKQRSTSQT